MKTNYSVNDVDQKEDLLLSFAQEHILLMGRYPEVSTTCNIPIVVKLAGQINPSRLLLALGSVMERHHILRSFFYIDGSGIGYQEVINDIFLPLEVKRIYPKSLKELNALISLSLKRVFDLGAEYPIAANLYNFKGEYYLSIVVHHIAFDHWSINILIRELLYYYDYHLYPGIKEELPALQVQYKDYALWQRSYPWENVLHEQLAYWMKELSGFEYLRQFADYVHSVGQCYPDAEIPLVIDREMSWALRKCASESGVNLYCLLLSSYYLLLHTYSGQEDLVVCTPFSNRDQSDTGDIIGPFANIFALRQHVGSGASLHDLIIQVSKKLKEAQLHQDLPFEHLVESLRTERGCSDHPMFQFMFTLEGPEQNYPEEVSCLFAPYKGGINHSLANFDLILNLSDSKEGIIGAFKYSTGLFKQETVNAYCINYKKILNNIISSII
jgi:hypothetical protein